MGVICTGEKCLRIQKNHTRHRRDLVKTVEVRVQHALLRVMADSLMKLSREVLLVQDEEVKIKVLAKFRQLVTILVRK